MDAATLGLLLVSAITHACWNLLAKASGDKHAFLWLALVLGQIALLPAFLIWFRPFPSEGLPYIAASGVLEAAYFILLGSAYQRGDFSLVYPLARGSAPVFVLLLAALLLGEIPSWGGVLGIALVVAGIYTLHLRTLSLSSALAPFQGMKEFASQLALLTGFTIATYSVIDKAGMSHVQPLTFLYLSFTVTWLLLLPYIFRFKISALKQEWHERKVHATAVGIMSACGFLLVLTALTMTRVSYVTPVREVSVVFAAILGTIVLREPFPAAKLAGASLIFAGVICISILTTP